MAGVGEDELEYESDPEDAKISLTMRRREASDDEDEDQEEEERERNELPQQRIDSRVSDTESEGAAAEYDDEESEFEEEELEVDEELAEGQQYRPIDSDVKDVAVELELDADAGMSAVEFSETNQVNHGGVDFQDGQLGDDAANGMGEKEKKENEPFAVPTAGAFYMHDDRFRDSAGAGRHRRNVGGRNLWESKDDRKWGHDKFEEMSMQERDYGEGRKASRGRNRGRGKIRGQERGYPRENRPKSFNNNNWNNAPNNENNAAKNPNNAPKGVRGRGPRRYQSNWNEAPTQNKQHGKSVESDSYPTSAKVSESNSNVESDPSPAKKHVFSSLNSVAPPFYPSASSNKEIGASQKKNGQDSVHRNLQSSVADKSFSMSPSNTLRGKNVGDFIGMNKLHIDDSPPTHTGNRASNSQLQVTGSSWANPSQSPHSGVQGRGQTPMGKRTYQSNPPHNQVNRISNPSQFHNIQQSPVQTRHSSLHASGRQLGQRTQVSSSPDTALMTTPYEVRESKSPPESNKLNTALIGKGKGVQGNGRGSFPYGGTQVVGASGNLGNAPGDNFPGMPFLPVMQFGGQHSGGMGVPAVGMAFPGYVGNPGSGNSEMTWLPVLTGPAGALGATYNSPYLSVDGAYHARPSGQVPSLAGAPSKENNMNMTANDLKPSQKQELVYDEFGQKQNKARRYTEMKFDN